MTWKYSILVMVQVLCWGVRDMKRFQLLKVDSPLVELECGGTVVRTRHIKNASKNPNFPEPIVTFDVVRVQHTAISRMPSLLMMDWV